MTISKRITDLKEPLDIDLQMVASELDTSVKNMKYISAIIITDAIEVEAFGKLCDSIEIDEGSEISSFDDNTTLYEFLDEAVVVHSILGNKYVIFDSLITAKIEAKMNSYI